jgi:hypothetical protein
MSDLTGRSVTDRIFAAVAAETRAPARGRRVFQKGGAPGRAVLRDMAERRKRRGRGEDSESSMGGNLSTVRVDPLKTNGKTMRTMRAQTAHPNPGWKKLMRPARGRGYGCGPSPKGSPRRRHPARDRPAHSRRVSYACSARAAIRRPAISSASSAICKNRPASTCMSCQSPVDHN